MTLRAIQIDDEPLAREKLANFLEKTPDITLIGSFSNCLEAIPKLQELQPDILFLDIEMNYMTGIEMLESAEVNASVIIISAYSNYALKGYDLHVTDYLLKPYSMARLVQAIEKVKSTKKNNTSTNRDFLFIKTDSRNVKISFSDILYIEGMRDYLCIHTEGKKTLTLMNFTELTSLLPACDFVRIHKSYLANIRHIDQVQHHHVYIGAHQIPISKSFRTSFYNLISNE